MKGLSSNCTALKADVNCYRTGKYTLCRHVPAFFSLEMLDSGSEGVKPRKSESFFFFFCFICEPHSLFFFFFFCASYLSLLVLYLHKTDKYWFIIHSIVLTHIPVLFNTSVSHTNYPTSGHSRQLWLFSQLSICQFLAKRARNQVKNPTLKGGN